jgi:hypothetical protein
VTAVAEEFGNRTPDQWRSDREFLKESEKWISEHGSPSTYDDDDDSWYDQPSSRD